MSRRRKNWFGRTPAGSRAVPHRHLCFEGLEQRLALTWLGVPPASITPPVSAASVTLNSQADATGTASIASTEVDYYAFTATSTGTYTISAATPGSRLDTVLGVFSANGKRLAYNDDIVYAVNTDSKLTVDLTAGTRYYVGITNYSSHSRGSYTWTINGPAATVVDDAYENNDSLSTAYNLGTLSSARTLSNLVMADTQDWYRFTTVATGGSGNSVSVSFQNAQGNLQLALYDATGTLLTTSQGTGNSESISLDGLAAGTYFVRVYGRNGALNPNYSLSINPPAAATTTPTSPVTAFPDVAYYGGSNEWNLNSVNAPESWAQGYTGDGVVVAVVDTGVDLDHPDLASNIWVNTDEIVGNGIDDDQNGYVDDVYGWDFASNDNDPNDVYGHGTHVAGIIAAEDNGVGSTGVAPDATIMSVRVLDDDGSGTESAVAAGIRYAAQNGADIINLSLGGSYSSVIYAAIQFAQSLDVLVVAAAGNESASSPSNPARSSATLSNVISVGAYSSSGSLASFSNDVGTSGAVQVDAPGVNVYSTYLNGRYATFSGTSMAAPHVAGLAALALSANSSLTASQLRTIIVNGANQVISGSDSEGGINAAVTVALAEAGQTSTTSSAAASTRSASSGPVMSARRLSPSSVIAGNGALASTATGSPSAASGLAAPAQQRLPSSTGAVLTARAVDHALCALGESGTSENVDGSNNTGEDNATAHALDEVFSMLDVRTSDVCRLSELALTVA